ncbi:MAG: hypothetical protein AAGF13_10535 [Pseudomonadota bacterium]
MTCGGTVAGKSDISATKGPVGRQRGAFFRGTICVACLALAACEQPTPPAVEIFAAALATHVHPDAAEAVRLFQAICGETLPNFDGVDTALQANGINQPSPGNSTTKFHPSGRLSFKVLDGPGVGKTCSMVFETTESKAQVDAALAELGNFRDSSLGTATLYKDTLVLTREPTAFEGRSVYNLRMLSRR